MAFLTYPITADAGMTVVDEQHYMHAAEKDRIVWGLTVSVVSGLTLRLSPGAAWVGGRLFRNTANYDFTTAANFGSGIKIDRLILRLTQAASGSLVAGVSADIQPVLITQTFPGLGGTLAPLTQNMGVGVYEVLVARWPTSTAVIGNQLVSIGPGACSARWQISNIAAPPGQIVGVPNLFLSVDTLGTWGHQPIFGIASDYFEVAHTGVYAISVDATFTNTGFVMSDTGWSWLRIEGWSLDKLDEFDGDGTNFRAKVDTTCYLPAGSTLRPSLLNGVSAAGTLNCTVALKVARVAE